MDEFLCINYTNGVIASIDRPELFEKFKHTFLRFNDSLNNDRLSYLSLIITSHFLKGQYKNNHKLKTDLTPIKVHWTDPFHRDNNQEKIKRCSNPINYKIIHRHLTKEKTFNHIKLILPELVSFWMDRSVDAAMNFSHKKGVDEIGIKDHLLSQQYGTSFPMTPQLNQEGIIITSFLPLIIKRIATMRNNLVLNSHLFHTSEWIFTLKSILNDAVSLVDISLNQLYLRACYQKKSTWVFTASQLKQRHGRRLSEKLNWVKAITGNDLKIEKEINSLLNIKNIRNHLNHFDPPVFVATLNEISLWLNQILDIVKIVIRIRLCAGEPLNRWLIELYLQHDIIFTPYSPRDVNINNSDFGYNSVRYPV